MLTIKNKDKLKGEVILRHTTDGYYIEGIVECKDHYQIDIRCSNKTLPGEMLILLRNKTDIVSIHRRYTLYDSNRPQRRVELTIAQIKWYVMFLHNIETILKMKN